jgi:hypothetical protein
MATQDFQRISDKSSGNYSVEHKNGTNEKLSASGFFKTSEGKTIEIRDVWASNLDAEMEILRELVEKYHFVAMVKKFLS